MESCELHQTHADQVFLFRAPAVLIRIAGQPLEIDVQVPGRAGGAPLRPGTISHLPAAARAGHEPSAPRRDACLLVARCEPPGKRWTGGTGHVDLEDAIEELIIDQQRLRLRGIDALGQPLERRCQSSMGMLGPVSTRGHGLDHIGCRTGLGEASTRLQAEAVQQSARRSTRSSNSAKVDAMIRHP